MSGFHPLFAFCAACLTVSILGVAGVLRAGDYLLAGSIGGVVMFVVWMILENAHKANK